MMKSILFCLICVYTVSFAQQPGENKVRISIPSVKGVLELNVGPTTSQMRVRHDGLATQMQAMARPDHLLISAFLQKVDFPASADKCRKELWTGAKQEYESTNTKMEQLTESSREGMGLVEFVTPKWGLAEGVKTVHAYLGARDLCADVHLVKVQFVAADRKLLDDVLSTVRLLPDEEGTAPQPAEQSGEKTSFYYISAGHKFYLQKDYAQTIPLYQKALDMEKQKRTLDQIMFRVLVDDLATAYVLNGNFPKYMETLQYGITQDPEYPMFHYGVASGYYTMNKMDEALQELRLVYKYKANSIPGEGLPDPLHDGSFSKWEKEKKFVDAVHQMQMSN